MTMISDEVRKKIVSIWDDHIANQKLVVDTKGNPINNIDATRLGLIEELKKIIAKFQNSELNIYEFKSAIDSFNKRNNLWGFAGLKGGMFFNHLVKTSDESNNKLVSILKESIGEPKNLQEAMHKIALLENHISNIFQSASDKRKAPNPGSIGYFLSYFWQIYSPTKWPIMYTSLIRAYNDLGIWEHHELQKDSYEYFFNLNEEIKRILKTHTGSEITNWDAEHAFWNFSGNPASSQKKSESSSAKPNQQKQTIPIVQAIQSIQIQAGFQLADYIIPKVANLVACGNEENKSAASKGYIFEKMVAEVFELLDFKVDTLGQGKGRNPDAILKHREENTAFIVDAKAYNKGYSLGIDDRAIREYISHHCPSLQKEGYKKIGFIIVCNSFKEDYASFVNDITWNTDIKRFIFLTSEALLYLLAYKIKDKLNLSIIIERMIGIPGIATAEKVIQEFEDF